MRSRRVLITYISSSTRWARTSRIVHSCGEGRKSRAASGRVAVRLTRVAGVRSRMAIASLRDLIMVLFSYSHLLDPFDHDHPAVGGAMPYRFCRAVLLRAPPFLRSLDTLELQHHDPLRLPVSLQRLRPAPAHQEAAAESLYSLLG